MAGHANLPQVSYTDSVCRRSVREWPAHLPRHRKLRRSFLGVQPRSERKASVQRSSPSVQSASTPPRSSTVNEPYRISPARRYRLMTAPVEEVVLSIGGYGD